MRISGIEEGDCCLVCTGDTQGNPYLKTLDLGVARSSFGACLPVTVPSLSKEPLLFRAAALIRDSPTQGIKTGHC
jgi:hypothetical protein